MADGSNGILMGVKRIPFNQASAWDEAAEAAGLFIDFEADPWIGRDEINERADRWQLHQPLWRNYVKGGGEGNGWYDRDKPEGGLCRTFTDDDDDDDENRPPSFSTPTEI